MKVWSLLVYITRLFLWCSVAGKESYYQLGTAAESSWISQRGGSYVLFGGSGYISFTEFSCVGGTEGPGANPCPSSALRVYNTANAQLAGSVDTKYNGAYRVLNPGPDLLVVVPKTKAINPYIVQSVSGSSLLSLTIDDTRKVISRKDTSSCSIDQPSTGYIYYVGILTTPSTKTLFRKIDINTVNNNGNLQDAGNYQVASSVTTGFNFWIGQPRLAWFTDTQVLVFDTVSMTLQGSLVIGTTPSFGFWGTEDPQAINLFFTATSDWYTILRVSIAADASSMANTHTVTLSAPMTGAVRARVYNYLLVSSASSLILYTSQDLTVVTTLALTTTMQYSLSLAAPRNDQDDISMIDSSLGAQKIYSVTFGACAVPQQNPCQKCKPESNTYLNSTAANNDCWAAEEFPAAHGPSGEYYLPCTSSGCELCLSDAAECQKCAAANSYPLDSPSGACTANTLVGKGLVLTASVNYIGPCADPNCLDCFADTRVCNACNGENSISVSSYYRVVGQQDLPNCYQKLPGYGLIQTGAVYRLTPCQVSQCSGCALDITTCTQCSNGLLVLEPERKKCVSEATTGIVGVNSTSAKACPTFCEKCDSTALLCTQCVAGRSLDPQSQCSILLQLVTVVAISGLDSESGAFRLTLDRPAASLAVDQSHLTHRLVATDGTSVSTGFEVVYSRPDERTVQGVVLGVSLRQTNQLVLESSTGRPYLVSSEYWVDPANTIKILTIPLSLAVESAPLRPEVVAVLRAATVTTALTATSGGGGSRLAALLKMLDSVEFLLYLDGRRINRAEEFLRYFSVDLMQVVPNLFYSTTVDSECTAVARFGDQGQSCSFLNNQGSTVTGLLGVAVLAAAIVGAQRVASRGRESEHKVVRWTAKGVHWGCRALSLLVNPEIAFSFIEGSQIELYRMAFLNLRHFGSEGSLLAGSIVALAVLLFYGGLGYLYVRYAKSQQVPEATGNEGKTRPRGALDWCLEEVYDGYKQQPGRHWYLPGIIMAACILQQAFLVMLAGHGLVQTWAILAVAQIERAIARRIRRGRGRALARRGFRYPIKCRGHRNGDRNACISRPWSTFDPNVLNSATLMDRHPSLTGAYVDATFHRRL